MKELFYDKKNCVVVAETWDEVSASQFILLSKLIHSGMDNISFACDKALHILSGKWLLPFLLIPPDMRIRMHEHVQWVFEEIKTTKQVLVKYRGLYGPEDNFGNLLLCEFHHSETAYHRIIHKDDAANALDELIAILFREPKPKPYNHQRDADGDHRIDFCFADIQYHQRKTKKWPLHIKQALLLWYDACREDLRLRYPRAFEGDGGSSANYFDGLFGMIRGLSGNRYGDFNKVEKLNVHIAFRDIVESILEAEELERKYKQK